MLYPYGGIVMAMKRLFNRCLLAAVMIFAAMPTAPVLHAAEPFIIFSPAFKDGTTMPKKSSNNTAGSTNCAGENISPPLNWANPPAGTKSYALTIVDPEARGGLGVIQWVAYGIPVSLTGFAEGEVSKASDKYVGGKGSAGVGHYMGPCTRPGAPHHYTFILIATDLEPKELPPGLTRDELLAKLTGRAKGATGLVGLFKNPYD
jgi:Raf kinase inhibitor-like YbhB/YbcL family protein